MYYLGISFIKFTSVLVSKHKVPKTRTNQNYLDQSKRFGFEVWFLFSYLFKNYFCGNALFGPLQRTEL